MSKFDDWYKNNPTSCDPKRSHIEGRIFILNWILKLIGIRSLNGRNGQWSFIDKLKSKVGKELQALKDDLN